MRKIFVIAATVLILACSGMQYPAQAGGQQFSDCSGACQVLQHGHVRGRLPIACVHIPFVKEHYGKVAMFILRSFDPTGAIESVQDQLKDPKLLLREDSKVTGPIDDFCRNPKFFRGATAVVLCDEQHLGWIKDDALAYTVRHGRPLNDLPVLIGTHVHVSMQQKSEARYSYRAFDSFDRLWRDKRGELTKRFGLI